MSGDIKQFLEQQKLLILQDKKRLGLAESENVNICVHSNNCEDETPSVSSQVPSATDAEIVLRNRKETVREQTAYDREDDKENRFHNRNDSSRCTNKDKLVEQKVPSIVEPLDWTRGYESPRDQEKRALIDSLSNSEDYFSSKSDGALGSVDRVAGTPFGPPLLRRGEFAPPSNARLRAAPHAGLGEYELARALYRDRRKEDYLRHLAESKKGAESEKGEERRVGGADGRTFATKFVQTDIENINSQLVQYESGSVSARRTVTDELVDAALRKGPLHVDQRLTTEQNDILLRAMDKPKSILSNRRTGSPRDLSHSSYMSTAFMDGFSYSDRGEELERERLKREAYQRELRIQIEEKRHLQAMREEQERRERELENRRLEQQLLRMQEEQAAEEQRRAHRSELLRRHSDDHLRRKTELHELQRPWRRHTESESGPMDGMSAAHYSPPVARRGLPYSSYSFSDPNRYSSSSYTNVLRKEPTSYDTVPLRSHRRFDRFDSLSRIDSLSHRLETMSVRDGVVGDLGDVQRRHSATQQDLSLLRKSPRLHRRNSASRFEESLPTPLLKARSPVAKELRNAVPFSSQRRSGGGVLTQLGSIRAQLQREQLRMDETLRRRGLVRTRTTEDY
ncbi:hypothetical protein GWI33_016755 [Rhynchophorus ferrugineus]|uniref:Uncharacterized protein n=1 Tax=Rhynchophorus ferrugineus TaxID=354439 RepID=A0A834I0L1_RHYFE|nr:hypothetical protein GWI33_016755 [Rhynchophorus ferrugineus]